MSLEDEVHCRLHGTYQYCASRTCSIAGVITLAMKESAGGSVSFCVSLPAGDVGLRRHAAYMPQCSVVAITMSALAPTRVKASW